MMKINIYKIGYVDCINELKYKMTSLEEKFLTLEKDLEADSCGSYIHEEYNKLISELDSCKHALSFIKEEFEKLTIDSDNNVSVITCTDDEIADVKKAVYSCKKWKSIVPYLIEEFGWQESPNLEIKKMCIIAYAKIDTHHLK